MTFTLDWSGNIVIPVMFTSTRCLACKKISIVLSVDIKDVVQANYKEGKLFIYPEPTLRKKMPEISESPKMSAAMNRSYSSAVNVYNTGEWNATAMACRRLLEGVTATFLPKEKHGLVLAKRLEALPSYISLDRPILTLADAIRKGGNLGAHFDEERETDETTATMMIDLLEYLIQYLFVIPKQIEQLHARIDLQEPQEDHSGAEVPR
jgi:hypothetical protein